MKDKFSVCLENVSKKFSDNLRTSMAYGIRDITKDIFGLKNRSDKLRVHEFWSVDDISFDLSRGEILGIIGSNGAGKSTLLKLINGIFLPDKGRITVNGRVGALIELGAGFHPMLTGKENVYINAAILGIPRKKVDRKFKGIVDFSGIGDFINMPVKFYSSGMHARLGFSVAAYMDADILLIDEVLAVGDQEFQEKSMKHMVELMRANKAVIIVSHSLYRIESLCDRAIWIEKGHVVALGHAKEIITQYLNFQDKRIFENSGESISTKNKKDLIEIEKVELVNEHKVPLTDFPFGSEVGIRLYYFAHKPIYRPHFNINLLYHETDIVEAGMNIDGHGPDWVEGYGMVECKFPYLPLTPKTYKVYSWVSNEVGTVYVSQPKIVAQFRITDDGLDWNKYKGPMAMNHMRQGSPVCFPHEWKFYDSSLEEMCNSLPITY